MYGQAFISPGICPSRLAGTSSLFQWTRQHLGSGGITRDAISRSSPRVLKCYTLAFTWCFLRDWLIDIGTGLVDPHDQCSTGSQHISLSQTHDLPRSTLIRLLFQCNRWGSQTHKITSWNVYVSEIVGLVILVVPNVTGENISLIHLHCS